MEELHPLIIESLQLLLIGMGTVFIILTSLIFLISFTSKLLSRYEDEPPHVNAPVMNQPNKQVNAGNDSELIAVISSAISAFKKKHSAD